MYRFALKEVNERFTADLSPSTGTDTVACAQPSRVAHFAVEKKKSFFKCGVWIIPATMWMQSTLGLLSIFWTCNYKYCDLRCA